MTSTTKTRKVIAYKQGDQWIVNDNGQVNSVPSYLTTKKALREYLAEMQRQSDPDVTVKITFA